MKKILLGTTALAATLASGAAMAEEPIKLSLGGYFRAYGIYQNSDLPNLRSTYLTQQGRIAISGSTTLDNGITAGVFVQLRAGEAANQAGESGAFGGSRGIVRRAYGFFEGSFGRLEFGSNDGAATQLGYTSPDPAPASGVNSPNFYPNAPKNSAGANGSTPTTYQNWDGSQTKITYFTPRVAGFQFGVSFTPEACQTGPSAATSGTAGAGCPGLGNAPSDNSVGQQSEVWQLGTNYTNTFAGVDVAVSGTFQQGSLEATDGFAPALKDRQSYSFGANLGYAGFTLGGAYLHDNEGVEDSSVHAWDIGLKYVTGPWSAGIQYIDFKRDNPDINITEDSVKAFMIGGGYALGPGIDIGIGYQNWSWDTKGTSAATATEIAARKNDADLFLLGTVFKF
jgi:predicted porin